jgi:L-lactate dehydrogenase complex protein LldG
MATKEEFLAIIRAALANGRNPDAAPTPAHTSSTQGQGDLAQRAANLREDLVPKKDALLAQLKKSAGLQEWKMLVVASHTEARDAVINIATGLNAQRIVRTAHLAVERLDLDEAFWAKSIECVLLASGAQQPDPAHLQEIAAQADIGVTGVDYLIAETASASLVSREGMSRMASLLPPVHIAVAHMDQVVESLEDLLTLREAELGGESSRNWYMNLVSGPSKTADIEQTIVIGVHGPGEVHLVLVTG